LDGLSRDTLGYGLLLLANDWNRRLARVGFWQRLVQILVRGELRLILRHGHPELRSASCITSFWLLEGGRRRRMCLIDRSIYCFRRFLQDNRRLLVEGVVVIVDFQSSSLPHVWGMVLGRIIRLILEVKAIIISWLLYLLYHLSRTFRGGSYLLITIFILWLKFI
jgi:hypothetical protein